jgi:hypothetical protein
VCVCVCACVRVCVWRSVSLLVILERVMVAECGVEWWEDGETGIMDGL